MPNVLPFRKGFLTLHDPANVEMSRQTVRLVVPRGWGWVSANGYKVRGDEIFLSLDCGNGFP